MKMSLTKKPMKPMTMKPSAVCVVILLNSVRSTTDGRWACFPREPPGAPGERGEGSEGRVHVVLSHRAGTWHTFPVGLGTPLHEADAVLPELLQGRYHGVHAAFAEDRVT